MGGLAVIATAAALGGQSPGPPRATVEPSAVATGAVAVVAPPAVLVLEHPAREGLLIRPTDLLVAGRLAQPADRIRVLVETARNKPIAVRTTAPVPPAGDPDGPPERFAVLVPLVDPREGERLIIHVIAYDAAGLPLEALRRRVIIGPHEPGVFGEDGLMGSRPFPSERP